jgi:PAS domain S-box-containing protein
MLVATTGQSAGRILIVEDERIIARDLTSTLAGLGYAVVGAVATADAAITEAARLQPDLILMDIRLHGTLDGVHAAEVIHRSRDVPIIYLTAHSDDETLQRAKRSQPLAYLVKPFKAAELRCAIEIALHKHEIDARLHDREQWLATLLRSIGDAVVATDRNNAVTMLNPIAEALTGWSQQEAIGRTLEEILPLVDQRNGDRVDNPVRQALATGTPTALAREAALVDKGGAVIPIDDRAAAILNDEGEVLGSVMIFRDATEQRQREQEIRTLNTELERRVVERTALLEAANRELEAFSYSVAHDLRAPLRGIDGFSQALIEEHAANLGADGLAHLFRVRSAAQRMGYLIDDLLRLAHIAQLDLTKQPVELSQLAHEVLLELKTAHPHRTVECRVEPGITCQGDPRLLRILLENLLGNAWKFSSKVTRPVIEFGSAPAEGRGVCFVRDNGAGFDMEYAHKLFCAFQRLHSASEFEGSGIGLAIVQRVINRHGGRIWAQGAPGRGATFFFIV